MNFKRKGEITMETGYIKTNERNEMKTERYAYLFIKYIQANQSLIGTKYLIYIIKTVLKEPMKIQALTKEGGLYGETAEAFNVESSSRVERGLRHLIDCVYEKLAADRYEVVFGTTEKVTNKQFIEAACNFIRYESDKLDGNNRR